MELAVRKGRRRSSGAQGKRRSRNLPTTHPIGLRWPEWEFGVLPDGRRYARRGLRIVAGPSLGHLDRVLRAEPPAGSRYVLEWGMAA
ncbi:hypothetical protein J0910_01980 [Nocardiopsis sp. CNT-189]|uniref:hypothetical protein n=1 Tax=Nocardiopsis oceanisediminis TaxID=2816862 RepID=UPI003B3427BC